MADSKAHPTATEMDFPAHERNYGGFLSMMRWGAICAGLAVALVIYLISN